MKTKIYSYYSKFISVCLLALGFSACSSLGDDPDPVICEYGVPSAKYKVSGKVVSAEGEKKAVKGIRVVMIDNVDESKNTYIQGDTVFTDADGVYKIDKHSFPQQQFKVKFQDVDGEDNGEFEEKIEIIDFKDAQYTDGGRWYKGEATKDMGTVELEAKKNTPKD